VALADYACCPYDDYGLPDSDCTTALSEKTPFDGSTFQQNSCKAWEFNADAIFDGNDKCNVNYGQCGFQRQFAWGGAGEASIDQNDPIGQDIPTHFNFDAGWQLKFAPSTTAAATAAWDTSSVAQTPSDFSTLTADTRQESQGWGIGKAPKLGAYCKLFVPVPYKHIVQVQIAGVHKAADSPAAFPAQFAANTAQKTAPAFTDGTVFCFSVVNPAEADVNSNFVGNGNVNGRGNVNTVNTVDFAGSLRVGDDFTGKNSLERQAGLASGYDWNSFLVGTAAGSNPDGDLNNAAGANFDVVAHFTTDWCTRGQAATEMQQTGDENYGDGDYQLSAGANAHAHNDIIDKRFAADEYGRYTVSNGYMTRQGSSLSYRWPNQGAWAGYHSVITCAQRDNAAGHNIYSTDREYVMSVSSSDFRQGSTVDCNDLTYRFNVRQVGDKVANCGPGQLPDADDKRCTWNWNYQATAQGESEEFFDRTNNMVFDTWTRKRRGAQARTDATPNQTAPSLQTVAFTFDFKDGDGVSYAAADINALEPDATGFNVATSDLVSTLSCRDLGAAGSYRDNFPDCFFGDELHYTVRYTAKDSSNPKANVKARISSWFSEISLVTLT